MRTPVLAALVLHLVAQPPGQQTASESSTGALVYRPSVVVQVGVSNLDRAIEFYTSVLEMKVKERRDDLKFAHVTTNVPGLEIGLSESPTPAGSGSSVINLSVVDVTAARALLEGRGVRFSGPTQIIPGKVALAGFADPDGNRLRLAGPPPRQ
jgi:predicted enzyme related to lactoylglutathione lyase